MNLIPNLAVREVQLVRFGREGQIGNGLIQNGSALGITHLNARVEAPCGKQQCLRISESDVLRGTSDESSRNIPFAHASNHRLLGLLASLDHATEPVQRGVDIAASLQVTHGEHNYDGFVERGNDVVVLLPIAVILHESALH